MHGMVLNAGTLEASRDDVMSADSLLMGGCKAQTGAGKNAHLSLGPPELSLSNLPQNL